MFAAIDAGQIVVPLIVALIAAGGAMAVGWRRLTVLGTAERGKLEAEKHDIIQTAEDRATGRALEALKLALDVSERERDRVTRELREAREEFRVLQERFTALERTVSRHDRQINGGTKDAA